jgi:hypothetical protein
MKKGFNTLSAALGTTLLLASFGAYAEDPAAAKEEEDTTKPRAVLFKIHDIQPVIDADGAVTECEFNVTFYNRTNDSFRLAKLNFGWQDSITGRYLTDEPSKPVEPAQNQSTRGRSRRSLSNMSAIDEANVQAMDIQTNIEMPSLGSYKQATVKGSVRTDKCFLLLDKLAYTVTECNIIGKVEQEQTARRARGDQGSAACKELFEFVDSKNPEYYDEFKDISYSESERLTNDANEKEIKDFTNAQKKIMDDLNEADKILDSIK